MIKAFQHFTPPMMGKRIDNILCDHREKLLQNDNVTCQWKLTLLSLTKYRRIPDINKEIVGVRRNMRQMIAN